MKITKKWARGALKAVEATIEKYENEACSFYCPLCSFAGGSCPIENCPKCPWVVFEEKTCMRLDYVTQPISDRIKRLNRWANKLRKIIDETCL